MIALYANICTELFSARNELALIKRLSNDKIQPMEPNLTYLIIRSDYQRQKITTQIEGRYVHVYITMGTYPLQTFDSLVRSLYHRL